MVAKLRHASFEGMGEMDVAKALRLTDFDIVPRIFRLPGMGTASLSQLRSAIKAEELTDEEFLEGRITIGDVVYVLRDLEVKEHKV